MRQAGAARAGSEGIKLVRHFGAYGRLFMALHFLDNTGLGFMRLKGQAPNEGPHCLELFESGGELFLRVGIDGNNPGGCARELVCKLSLDDAKKLEEGAASLLRRLSL